MPWEGAEVVAEATKTVTPTTAAVIVTKWYIFKVVEVSNGGAAVEGEPSAWHDG